VRLPIVVGFSKRVITKGENDMAILKSPTKSPKNETVQVRVEEEIKTKPHKYAEFIDSTESYVVSEALKLLFRKDDEFKVWLEQHGANGVNEQLQSGSILETTRKS
jgi:predicted transcriptional regulator